ncbi:hypothetical protein Scel_20580 [Streptomyces cellostaticus]|nr:hypothetical protein Scel_20580 [Streptomyces cellostaticus]
MVLVAPAGHAERVTDPDATESPHLGDPSRPDAVPPKVGAPVEDGERRDPAHLATILALAAGGSARLATVATVFATAPAHLTTIATALATNPAHTKTIATALTIGPARLTAIATALAANPAHATTIATARTTSPAGAKTATTLLAADPARAKTATTAPATSPARLTTIATALATNPPRAETATTLLAADPARAKTATTAPATSPARLTTIATALATSPPRAKTATTLLAADPARAKTATTALTTSPARAKTATTLLATGPARLTTVTTTPATSPPRPRTTPVPLLTIPAPLAPVPEGDAVAYVQGAGEDPGVGDLLPRRAPFDLEHRAGQRAVGVAVGAGEQPLDPGDQVVHSGTGDGGPEGDRVHEGLPGLGGEGGAQTVVGDTAVHIGPEQVVVVVGEYVQGGRAEPGDEAGGAGAEPGGRPQGHERHVQPARHLAQHGLAAGAAPVDLVDEDQRGDAQPAQGAHEDPGLRLDALDGRDDQDGAVEHAEHPLHLGDEVRVTGSVDQVDGDSTERERHDRRLDGDAAPAFQRQRVRPGTALVDDADRVRYAGRVQQPFGQAGLTGVYMRENSEIEQMH